MFGLSARCFVAVLGAAACKPPTAALVPDDKPSAPATPTHEALDVPVINASRGEASMTAPQVVWTGTEAVYLYTEPGWMAPLWVGRMDGRGKWLDRRRVALDRGVGESLYPVWVDGAIAAVFKTELTDHWVKVASDGTLRANNDLGARTGQEVVGTDGAMHSSGRFAAPSIHRPFQRGERPQLELYDPQGHHTGTVPTDCDSIGDIAATDWGYAVSCEGQYLPNEPGALSSTVLGVRDGKVVWTSGGLPSGRNLTLGSDGERVLIVYEGGNATDTGVTYPVTTLVLDSDGLPEAAPVSTQSYPPQADHPMIWTGKEFATFVGALLIRYSSDGRPLGVWEVEPRCNRDFEISGLTWTGSAYLVLGRWGWRECLNEDDVAIDDGDRVHPLAPGLTWDPATDAVLPPGPSAR